MNQKQFREIKEEFIRSRFDEELVRHQAGHFRHAPKRDRELHSPRGLVQTFGPSQPIMPLGIQLRLGLEGKNIVHTDPEIGFSHQGIEKLFVNCNPKEGVSLISRLNPTNHASLALAYILAIEKKITAAAQLDLSVQLYRMLILESSRASHHLSVCNNTLSFFSSTQLKQMLSKVDDLSYALYSMIAFNQTGIPRWQILGIGSDINIDDLQIIIFKAQELLELVRDTNEVLVNDNTLISQLSRKGTIKLRSALSFAITGPALRACGRADDVRKHSPYLAYDKFLPSVHIRKEGDLWARTTLRFRETEASLHQIMEILSALPSTLLSRNIQIPSDKLELKPGIEYAYVEAPEGELIIAISSDESGLKRVRIRTPSFALLSGLPLFLDQANLDDVTLILSSLGIDEFEADR